jgi:dipeptidyl aminopeptidase/acylaminoacyl peptidase
MMRRALLLALAAASALAGCTLPPPDGDPPLRYRDHVFSTVSVTRDLSYGSAPDAQGNAVDLKLDLYQPAGDTVARRPALVWVHGGGFTAGSKSSGATIATFYARLGYVAVSIDYRLLSPTGCGGNPNPTPTCVAAALGAQHDAQAAVRWLRRYATTYRVDPDRIAMGGGSAGAVTSLLAAWRSEDPGTSGNPGFPSTIRAAVSVSGGTPTDEYIGAGDAGVLFIHGTEDQTVPYHWAVSNAGRMFNLRLPVVLESLAGAGHGLSGQYRDLIHQQSSYFLYGMLDLSRAGGQPASAARAFDRQVRRLRARHGG